MVIEFISLLLTIATLQIKNLNVFLTVEQEIKKNFNCPELTGASAPFSYLVSNNNSKFCLEQE